MPVIVTCQNSCLLGRAQHQIGRRVGYIPPLLTSSPFSVMLAGRSGWPICMEPRIQYARTKDGVSMALWTLGSGMRSVLSQAGSPGVIIPTHC